MDAIDTDALGKKENEGGKRRSRFGKSGGGMSVWDGEYTGKRFTGAQ
jgi:hypothetical protein